MWKVINLTCALTLMAQGPGVGDRQLLLSPDSPEMNRRAPDVAHVRLETTKGVIRLEMRRAWAPHGVDRFYNLVRHGFYDQAPVRSEEHTSELQSHSELVCRLLL